MEVIGLTLMGNQIQFHTDAASKEEAQQMIKKLMKPLMDKFGFDIEYKDTAPQPAPQEQKFETI